MQEHLDRTRSETMAIREQVDKARRVLDGLGSLGVPEVPSAIGEGAEEVDVKAVGVEREEEVWAMADALFA